MGGPLLHAPCPGSPAGRKGTSCRVRRVAQGCSARRVASSGDHLPVTNVVYFQVSGAPTSLKLPEPC
jgi:hypothetical protein